MRGAWEKRRRNRRYLGVVVGVVLLILGAVIVRNNLDMLGWHPAKVPPEKTEEVPRRGAESDSAADTLTPSHIEPVKDGAPPPAGPYVEMELTNIRCTLPAEADLTLLVSLSLRLADERFRDTLLMKRGELRVMVKKVFMSKQLSDIVVDELRAELMQEAATFVGEGVVEDIEFTDFRPLR
jgi:flagellar basal body-associated protein FliL